MLNILRVLRIFHDFTIFRRLENQESISEIF